MIFCSFYRVVSFTQFDLFRRGHQYLRLWLSLFCSFHSPMVIFCDGTVREHLLSVQEKNLVKLLICFSMNRWRMCRQFRCTSRYSCCEIWHQRFKLHCCRILQLLDARWYGNGNLDTGSAKDSYVDRTRLILYLRGAVPSYDRDRNQHSNLELTPE